jgi:hypothetical protein
VCTSRWLREFVFESCHCIIKHSHVMHRSRPPIKDKCKKHIEVTSGHDILGYLALATQVLHELILWHDHRNVSAIYCPYATMNSG